MALFFIRVDAANEGFYEMVAGPDQAPQAGGQQGEEAVERAPEEISNPADLQDKPRSITFNFNIRCLSKYLCIYVSGSCMEP